MKDQIEESDAFIRKTHMFIGQVPMISSNGIDFFE
jgi:hypothetical protein